MKHYTVTSATGQNLELEADYFEDGDRWVIFRVTGIPEGTPATAILPPGVTYTPTPREVARFNRAHILGIGTA